MAASHASLFPLLTFLWVISLFSPVRSLTCSSQKLPNSKVKYDNCTDLGTLNSTLHYSYDAANSSLSVAFVAAPPSPNGWVAWGINPTATGMAGTQALLAHKSDSGPVVVKTYNLASYGSIVESKLSFEVWNLSAADSGGSIVIYATVKVPANVERLNQVWQVGPISGGQPAKHEFKPENLQAKSELVVAARSIAPEAAAASPGPAAAEASPGTAAAAASPGTAAKNVTGSGSWVRPGKMGLWAGTLVLFVSSALA